MPCTYCDVQFTLIKWKTKCQICSKQFCSNCTVQKKCLSCRNILGSRLDYGQLMKLKVKDLKLYLSSRGQPASLCKEKQELVQMILRHHNISWVQPETVHIRVRINRNSNLEDISRVTEIPDSPRPSTSDTVSSLHATSSSHSSLQNAGNGASGVSHEDGDKNMMSAAEDRAATTNVAEERTTTDAGRYASVPKPVPTGNRNKLLITDLTMVAQIDNLTSREMMQILTDNFVDYKGCVEKSELRVRVKSLYSDRSRNTKRQVGHEETEHAHEEHTCKICWDNPIDCVLLECGHMATCTACGKRLSECPICRQYIVRCVHVFRT